MSDAGDEDDFSGDEAPAMRVVRRIEERLSTGLLSPGQRLVERELAAEFCTTRRAVREALRYLAGAQVVELSPNQSARVARPDPKRLAAILEVHGSLLRGAMEAFARYGPRKSVDLELTVALEGVLGAVQTNQPLAMLRSMAAYMDTIVTNCGNDFFLDALKMMRHELYNIEWANRIHPTELAQTCEDFRKLHEKILARDAEGAFRVLNEHILTSVQQVRDSTP